MTVLIAQAVIMQRIIPEHKPMLQMVSFEKHLYRNFINRVPINTHARIPPLSQPYSTVVQQNGGPRTKIHRGFIYATSAVIIKNVTKVSIRNGFKRDRVFKFRNKLK